jgi:hypothetical protein
MQPQTGAASIILKRHYNINITINVNKGTIALHLVVAESEKPKRLARCLAPCCDYPVEQLEDEQQRAGQHPLTDHFRQVQMPSGTLYSVSQVRTDVSENISKSRRQNTLTDHFRHVQMPFDTLYSVAQVRTDVSENISSPSSGFLRVIGSHSCVTVESLLISLSIDGYYVWSKNTVLWDALTAVRIIVVEAFWDDLPCSSSSSRRFREYIVFSFRVP